MGEWMDSFEIEWRNEAPEGVEALVREDMLTALIDLECPDDLFFHSVFLEDDMEGQSVFVTGGAGKFYAEYMPVTEWVSASSEGE